MPKISRATGATPPSPAEILRQRGKLGPYGTEEERAALAAQQAEETEPAPAVEPEPAPEPVTEAKVAVERPPEYATKSEWVSYVAAITDQPEDEIRKASKAELIEIYGS